MIYTISDLQAGRVAVVNDKIIAMSKKISKTEIDRLCRKYKRGELTPEQVEELAKAIKENPKTRDIAINGLLRENRLQDALKLLI